MSARDNILAKIVAARDKRPATLTEASEPHQRGPIPTIEEDLIQRFCSQATRLASDISLADSLSEVPGIVAAYLHEHALPLDAVCWPGISDLDWSRSEMKVKAGAASADDLVGITGAFLGIAETGTLMLLSGPETPATVSLLPETHIAILNSTRIVATMEDAWERLRAERGALPRAVNFVSGPSRTADIEQTVTLGAHGPYRVLIVVVKE